jgi:hypothetical protein
MQSALGERCREDIVEICRRMSPAERLQAFVNHSRAMAALPGGRNGERGDAANGRPTDAADAIRRRESCDLRQRMLPANRHAVGHVSAQATPLIRARESALLEQLLGE